MLRLDINRGYMTQIYLSVCVAISMLTDLSQSLVYTDGKTSVELVTHGHDVPGKDIMCYVYHDRKYTPKYPEEGLRHTDSFSLSNMVGDCLRIQGSRSSKHHTIFKRGLGDVFRGIFPGTKWCGRGNIAKTEAHVGSHDMTDLCCREHDNCAQFIKSGQNKYGIRNIYPYTISSCACDDRFSECLRNINDTPSRAIGTIFFNVVRVPCVKADVVYRYGVPVGVKAKLERATPYVTHSRQTPVREWLRGLLGNDAWIGK